MLRHNLRLLWLSAVLSCSAVAGCGADDETSDAAPPDAGTPTIDIRVDSNRDGRVDADDEPGEDEWSATHGAVLLPNLDDDDWDGVRDADDAVVDISPDALGDQYDLAPIVLLPWPDVPVGAVGQLQLDSMSAPHVRVFLRQDDGAWLLVLGRDACPPSATDCQPGVLELSHQQVAAGATLGIEATTLMGLPDAVSVDPGSGELVPWDGLVQLDYAVLAPDGRTPYGAEAHPDGFDRAVLRVAPWIDFGNLSPRFDTIFSSDLSPAFMQGVAQAAADDGLSYAPIADWDDRWTEDWMQTGFVSMPRADDNEGNTQVQGMRLAMPRPWGRTGSDADLPIHWLMQPTPAGHLGAGSGYFAVYREPHTGDGYDSFGNHELVPPYDHGDQHFPLGRIIHGSGVLPETDAFYEAQGVQAPVLKVDTSWLRVGHVDEVFSYAPAATPRGFKLLVASPELAVELLQQWQADGHGSATLFVGKHWSNDQSAEVSIDEVLGDADLMAQSQQAQLQIDGMLDTMRQQIGLTDSEIVPVAVLFWEEYGGLVAFTANAVNDLVFDDHIVIADPFGPNIDGHDGLKQDLLDRLATAANGLGADGQGLRVTFTDDWEAYHALGGEAHCGTNQEGPPPPIRWWELTP